MIATPFLTELDSRAAVKGSRDPLGIQPLWSRLGREVVGNLTTVSNSVPDFAVLLLGFHFIEVIAETQGNERDLATFLKWEQLAAYARGHNGDFQFRGTERVAQRLHDGGSWPIGPDRDAQILSDQKTYGLWGLYTVPAKSSGLIGGEPTRLTAAARDIVRSELLPQIDRMAPRGSKHIGACLSAPRYTLNPRKQADAQVLKAVGTTVIKPGSRTRDLFRDSLLHGGPSAMATHDRQRVLAALMVETLAEPQWHLTPKTVEQLAMRAGKYGDVGQSLADRLMRIRTAESVLAPAAALFQYLLGCDGQQVDQVAKRLSEHWGQAFQQTIPRTDVDAWTIEMAAWGGPGEMPARWRALAEALHAANYADAIALLLGQNEDVMQSRAAAAPWIRVANGKLDVRFKDDAAGRLPDLAQLPHLWRHPYFLLSLRDVAAFLEARP